MTRQVVLPPHLTSKNPRLVERSADLNNEGLTGLLRPIADGILVLARYLDEDDLAAPPAPAWYLPATHEIYIHTDAAEIGNPTSLVTAWRNEKLPTPTAVTLGLLAHETAHAGISDRITPIQIANPHHSALLTMLEELRVENHAVRRSPYARRFLRASFGLILANLPDDFTSKAHVVRAWVIARGRTLAGIAEPDETEAVDTAARTLLGDDIVDALTDLLQEVLTLPLTIEAQRERLIEICDEWHDLVGDPPETEGGCGGARTDDGEPGGEGTGSGPSDEAGDDTEEGAGGGGKAADDTPEPTGDSDGDGDGGDDGGEADVEKGRTGDEPGDWRGESGWGEPGADDPDADSDDAHADDGLLDDEDGELMKMVKRDLEDLMKDEWTRERKVVELAKSGEWGQKVFGNRKTSARLTRTEPTPEMRQHVVQVAAELSRLALPAISKVSKATPVPPGRMRSREALRASAERAQGKMVTARPWKTTVRRHTVAKPLVLGVATDTSGSMRWAERGVAEFAYVYANAGHRIGARTAAVTFGDHVHRIARPGEVLDKVVTKSASDGTEEFDQSMAALDGVLHLTAPGYSARILLVVSDGALVKPYESDKAMEWMRRMDKAGTHVVWITDTFSTGSGWGGWMEQAEKLPNFTMRPITVRTGRWGDVDANSVFDLLNAAALDAIKSHIA